MRIIRLCSILLIASAAAGTASYAQVRGFRLPPHAQQIEDGAYYLGRTRDRHGNQVDGIAFLHPRPGAAKPPGKPGGGGGGGGGSTCYSLMGSGARWKTPEPYLVDPATTTANLTDAYISSGLETCLANWENAAGRAIFGSEASGSVDRSAIGTLNEKNEFMFGAIEEDGVIAVTIVWGRFSGPPQVRELVEWDMIFDDESFKFGDADFENTPVMDFLNILQHETGHAAGLAHPSNTCIEETMYAYADFDETKKRSLAPGDIAGIRALYP